MVATSQASGQASLSIPAAGLPPHKGYHPVPWYVQAGLLIPGPVAAQARDLVLTLPSRFLRTHLEPLILSSGTSQLPGPHYPSHRVMTL